MEMNVHEKLGFIQSGLEVPKSQFNSYGNYNYRSAEDILAAVKPFLHNYGCTLLIEDSIEAFGDRLFLRADVTFLSSGEPENEIKTKGYAEICEHKGMSLDQCTGTASSYARKYALNAMFLLDDIKDSDTDEMAKMQGQQPKPATQQRQQQGGGQQPRQSQGGWNKQPQQSQQNTPAPAPVQNPPQPATKPASAWGKKPQSSGQQQDPTQPRLPQQSQQGKPSQSSSGWGKGSKAWPKSR